MSAMSGETTTVSAAANDGRGLVAERLAAAGRHDDERIAAIEDGPDRLLLQRAEGANPQCRSIAARSSLGNTAAAVTVTIAIGGNHVLKCVYPTR